MWRFTGIKPDTDLRGIPTDRLLQEYAKHAKAFATLNYMNQQAEFGTKEDPVSVDGQALLQSVQGLAIRQRVAEELKRRGVPVPE